MSAQLGHRFLYFLFYRFFSQLDRVGGRNINKINSDHFPTELKSKETQTRNCVTFDFNSVCVSFDFNSIGKSDRMNFIFILPIKMAISHQVLSLGIN